MSKTIAVLCVLFSFAAVGAFAAEQPNRTTHAKKKRVVIIEEDDYESAGVANIIGFQFGPEVGTRSLTVPNGQQPIPASTRTRPMFGMFYEHQFMPYLALRSGFDFTQRGFTTTDGAGQAATVSDFALNYIELPIMVKGQYSFGVVTPWIGTGPLMGLMVSQGKVVQQGGQQTESDLSNDLNTFNFAWNFGAGSTFKVSRIVNLEAGFRYSLGLTNVVANSPVGQSIRMNSLQFLGAFSLSL